ncbi:MAG: UDP-2,3-diacylglucosamine diphosphatase [Betaproteobacteria bacterium]|nr:UDP-2,3-diacylglucosamine diphosphatase [Betaproteobacteria bacterium]
MHPLVNANPLQAPAHWQAVDLISDLHLQASEPDTYEAWRAHMRATTADAVLLLGDVFEVWVGDDAVAADPFLQACAQVLRETSQRMTVGFMVGNRDFLVGPQFLAECGLMDLQDPTLLLWGAQRILLSHGDALCLGDTAYQHFRSLSRTPAWQADFLTRPLAERLTLAQSMRAQSEAHNQSVAYFADADADMSRHWLQAHDARWLIHGHTHRPADHAVAGLPGATRQVLSDWHAGPKALRAEVLRLHASGHHERLHPLRPLQTSDHA